ncbi:MAG: twin-arginine translocation signal domain-containing protein [Nitrospirae bacterium]|nr:MAG: twin-arginine translocation signal domain-containing protein [Nitrospirota bacterium]
MERRDFLKYSAGSLAALVVGSEMPWLMESNAYAAFQTPTLNFTITDAMKEMVTHNPFNDARCYFWIYKSNTPNLLPECPGPTIFTTEGDIVTITLTNNLDEPHSLYIPGIFSSGPIAPLATKTFRFRALRAGTYLYYDNLNAPVNRVMGLHGCMIVMPRATHPGHKFTPYAAPSPAVQKLFDDFGTSAHFPGLSWEQGDPATDTPAFRQYVWLCHQASPILFAEVGNFTAGLDYPAAQFANLFNNDPYVDTFNTGIMNRKPHFFTISGQSGHFAHNNPFLCPNNRVGEPVIIRVLNAGLQAHSMHIHANHVFTTSINGVVQENPLWVDTMTLYPLDVWDWTVPYIRPPDIPNIRGIGKADTPLTSITNPGIPGSVPHPVWPPTEELNTFLPPVGTLSGGLTGIDISCQLSPMCYPMHDHSEHSQGAQGGNYNCGLISGINFTGDRNTAGGVTTFPNVPTVHGPDGTGPAAG